MDVKSLARWLSGYLQCLRRLSGNRCDFWSFTISSEGRLQESLDDFFKSNAIETTILGETSIGYPELESLLREHLFSKLAIEDPNLPGLFAWDIVEQIQMSYRELELQPDPLSNGHAVCFSVHSQFRGPHVYMVIPVSERALAIALGTRA